MPLNDLIVYLGNKEATGSIRIERDDTRKQIDVLKGNVVNASSNEPREYLGQFLINLGHISEEQFNRAFETQQETKIFLGKILVMTNAVNEQTLANVLDLKIRETVLNACEWKSGTFAFDRDAEFDIPDGQNVSHSLIDLSREGEFRSTAWNAIRGAFPTGNTRLRLFRENLAEEPKPGSLDARLFESIEQGNTIDEIALTLHATDFFLYQRLYALHRLEAVKPDDGSHVDIDVDTVVDEAEDEVTFDVGSEASPDDIVGHMAMFVDAQNFDGALALAKRATEISPGPASQELLRSVESKYHAYLKATLIEPRKVPSLAMAPEKLKELSLSAPERYLLAKIDGKRNLGAIVHVSPIREYEALVLIQRFIERGLIRVA